MTLDPRVEAAARGVARENGVPLRWEMYVHELSVALAAADAVEGDRYRWPSEQLASGVSPERIETFAEYKARSGGGAEPSREDDFTVTGDELDLCLARAEAAEARVVELEGALESAIYLAEDKWPVEARTLRARFLAAAGEGEDRPETEVKHLRHIIYDAHKWLPHSPETAAAVLKREAERHAGSGSRLPEPEDRPKKGIHAAPDAGPD